MDASRFDSLARALSHSRSRRSIARVLGGLAFGGGISTQTARDALAATRIGGSPCQRDAQCKTGTCLSNNLCSCSAGFPKCRGDGAVCYRRKCCTPTCAGKQCGSDGCGRSCGSCVAPETCRTGVCSCGAGKDLCGGACLAACPDNQMYNPSTCACCNKNGTVFSDDDACFAAGCCSGDDQCQELTDDSGRYACQGRHGGTPCTFDAQCASGHCDFEFGTNNRFCRNPLPMRSATKRRH
jgi:hypothetical protein